MHKHYDLQTRRYHDDGTRRFLTVPSGASMTQKHQAPETDINLIVRRFGITGMLPQRLDALNLGAFEDIFDYQTAMNAVVAADRAFLQVPADVRARFQNDPQKFVEFATNPENLEEMRRLKLAPEAPVAVPDPVMKVEVVGGTVSNPPVGK